MSSVDPSLATPPSLHVTRSTDGARAEITAANARFMEAFARGDAAGTAACYTSDGQLLPNHSNVVAGTQAIEEFWRGAMQLGIASARLESVEVESFGDAAVEIGRYSLAAADGATVDRGKYLVVWHRERGTMKIHRDIWTTSLPQQAS